MTSQLHAHKSLSEACAAGYVLRQHGNYKISNAYWHWCTENVEPFIAISYTLPKQKYVSIEMDLLNTAWEGFNAVAGYEILHTLLGQQLKPKSTFSVGPTYISAWTTLPSAKALADYLYRSAIDEGILLTQDEMVKCYIDGLPRKSAFAPFSADVYKSVLSKLSTDEFWQSMCDTSTKYF